MIYRTVSPRAVGASFVVLALTCVTSVDASAQALPATISCVTQEVGTFADRVYVRCAASVGGIFSFAVPTKDPSNAARMLSILTTAHVAGRTLQLTYDPGDKTGPSFGCPAKDCRLLLGAWFGKAQ
jgi:hypothetical protein